MSLSSTGMFLSSLVIGFLFTLNFSSIKVNCSCAVSQQAAAVVVGDSLTLKCVSDSHSFVSSVYRYDDVNGTVRIYQSALYNNFGQSVQNKSVVDGYSVDDESTRPNMTLTLNKSVTAQAGYYQCQCTSNVDASSSFAGTYVSVLDSEPQFSSNGSSLSINDIVQLNCSVSFHGKANSSFQIFDGNGTVLANQTKVATSNMLQSPSLTYIIPTNDVIRNDYSCNVMLSNDSLPATAYNKTLKTTVPFSVRRITIAPESTNDCHENEFCKRNMKMLCSAEGSPNPTHNWTIYFNGSVLYSSELYYYTSNIGVQTIQCTAYNGIGGKTYNNSFNFTTNVTSDKYIPTPTASPSTADESKVPLIVGLVVGLGGGLIIILVIVIVVLWKRIKRRTHCCTLDGMKSDNGAQQMEVSNGAGKPGNGKITSGGPMPDVMPTQQKTRGSDETVLVENDIYARDSKAAPGHTNHIHTFDGGYSSLDDLDKK